MAYSKEYFKDVVDEYGEVFFVLDSGEEYEVHGRNSYVLKGVGNEHVVEVEGMRDGELLLVEFPLGAIEHHKAHREV